MATISITNQTLTISLIVDGATTVIRKDNCKVQAFGDVVRITDYTGTIYEFLYSDCVSPSEASGADLRDAIEAFLNTAGGGSSDYVQFVALLTQSGTSAPTVSTLKNDTGLTWTPSYDDVGNYFVEPSVAPDDTKVVVFCTNGSGSGDVFSFWRDDKLNVGTKASGVSANSVLSNTAVEVRIYP